MSGRLLGKVAIITGATSGIGDATARRFVAEGAQVLMVGRSESRGAALAQELGLRAVFHRADVMHESEIAGALDAAVKQFGKVDCLFNNAGASTPGELDTITESEFEFGMKLLVGSVVFGIKHASRVMTHGGSIINNSSIAAHRLGQGGMLYSTAKAAVSHLTRVAGVKLGPAGIRVNSISPGAIATPIFWGGSSRAETWPSWKRTWRAPRLCRAPENLRTSLTRPCSWPAMTAASSTPTIWWSMAAASLNFMSVR